MKNRIIFGLVEQADFNQHVVIRWDEEFENVTIEPIIIQKPKGDGIYNSVPFVSNDGSWVKMTYRFINDQIKEPRLVLYNVSGAYPQSLSMPMVGGYTDKYSNGAFVTHSEWGPCYIEKVNNKLFVYKLLEGMKMLADEAAKKVLK